MTMNDSFESRSENPSNASDLWERVEVALYGLSHRPGTIPETEPAQERVDIPDKANLIASIKQLPDNVTSKPVGNVVCIVTKTRDPQVFSLQAEETEQGKGGTVKYRTTYIINDNNGRSDTRTSVAWRPDNPTNTKGIKAKVVKEAWDIFNTIR